MEPKHSWDDAEEEEPTKPIFSDVDPQKFAVSVLVAVAWVVLLMGLVGAFVLVDSLAPVLGKGTALIVAACVLVQGAVVWAALLAFAAISGDLRAVRDHLVPPEQQ